MSYNNGNLRFCCAHVGMWQEEKDQATNVLKAFSCLVRKNISISTILILIRAFSCQKQYCISNTLKMLAGAKSPHAEELTLLLNALFTVTNALLHALHDAVLYIKHTRLPVV